MSADAVSVLPLRDPDALPQRALRIAVLVPCHNEAKSIETVIRDFRHVLVDGDATYHAPAASAMIDKLLRENLDMVVGCRVEHAAAAYRSGHRFGNAMLTGFVGHLFGRQFRDILSGYRVFSRRFVKSFPADRLVCAPAARYDRRDQRGRRPGIQRRELRLCRTHAP